MIEKLDIANVLFLDIETVSQQAGYDDLPEKFQKHWKLKSRQILRKYDEEIEDEEANALYSDKAAIYAEFGKIVCISVGIVVRNPATKLLELRLKSFANDDEATVLKDFSQMVDQYYTNPERHFFCGHNIREFDIPYICRRMVIQQLPLPRLLNISGKKPWETKHLIDTLELWKFGDIKNYTSLDLLTTIFGIPSPKEDMDGSEVGKAYWIDKDLKRIALYCEKDVLAVVQLLLKFMRQAMLEDKQIVHVDRKTV
jgi:uncharacterized protein YprB with RNaseH-like and TPR domain